MNGRINIKLNELNRPVIAHLTSITRSVQLPQLEFSKYYSKLLLLHSRRLSTLLTVNSLSLHLLLQLNPELNEHILVDIYSGAADYHKY